MKWIVRFVVVYAVALVLVVVVAVTVLPTPGGGQPGHSRMDPVSHNKYELHKSIGHVP